MNQEMRDLYLRFANGPEGFHNLTHAGPIDYNSVFRVIRERGWNAYIDEEAGLVSVSSGERTRFDGSEGDLLESESLRVGGESDCLPALLRACCDLHDNEKSLSDYIKEQGK